MSSVDQVRASLFWSKFNENGKIVELCLLPRCHRNLVLHLKRSNYVAYLFRNAHQLQMNLDSTSLHGWVDNSIVWATEHLPSDVDKPFLRSYEEHEEEDELDTIASESDDHDDMDIFLEDFS